MTKSERVRAALTGEMPVDGVPFTHWSNLRAAPAFGDGFVTAVLDFYRESDVDLLKVPDKAALFAQGGPDPDAATRRIDDLRAMADYKDDDAPWIETIPSVFTVLDRLGRADTATESERAELASAMAEHAHAVIEDAGAAGIFLTITGADAATMPAERYSETFLPLDARVLAGATEAGGWCNVLHLHAESLHLDALLPIMAKADAVSWSDRAFGPSLAELGARLSKTTTTMPCRIGGVNERTIAGLTPDAVRAEIEDAVTQMGGGRGLIVAPGCSVPTGTPPENLKAFLPRILPS